MGGEYNKKLVIITGFPYAFLYYWKVFEHLKNRDNFIFLLPDFWWAKDGNIRIKLENKPGFTVYGLKAMSYGGKSLFRGLFKGWMPGIGFMLPYLKIKYGSRVLYSCSEPHLLATLYNGIIAKLFGFKHILFTWQNVSPEERMSGLKLKLSNTLVKCNLVLSDGIICGNKKAEAIINRLKIRNSDLKTIVCPISGIDIDRFKPGNVKDNFVLFYGALDDRKGVNILVEAFSKLSDLGIKLVIIGTGPEKERLENLANQFKLGDRIIFHNWMKHEDLPSVLSKTLIFVYPSMPRGGWEEQFGYAMGEASSAGVPVIATRTGSIDEVIRDGETGILVVPGNVEALKTALEKLLRDDKLRQKMGLVGRDFIVNNFSHAIVADKISNFLNKFFPSLFCLCYRIFSP